MVTTIQLHRIRWGVRAVLMLTAALLLAVAWPWPASAAVRWVSQGTCPPLADRQSDAVRPTARTRVRLSTDAVRLAVAGRGRGTAVARTRQWPPDPIRALARPRTVAPPSRTATLLLAGVIA